MFQSVNRIFVTNLVVVKAAGMPFHIVVPARGRVEGAVIDVAVDVLIRDPGEGLYPGRRLWSLTATGLDAGNNEGDEPDRDCNPADSDGEGLEIET